MERYQPAARKKENLPANHQLSSFPPQRPPKHGTGAGLSVLRADHWKHTVSRLLVRVSRLQCGHGRSDQTVVTNHLHEILIDFFHLTLLPQVGSTAFQRAKLSLAECLPGTAIIIALSPCSSGKNGIFNLFSVCCRNIKTKLDHLITSTCSTQLRYTGDPVTTTF